MYIYKLYIMIPIQNNAFLLYHTRDNPESPKYLKNILDMGYINKCQQVSFSSFHFELTLRK